MIDTQLWFEDFERGRRFRHGRGATLDAVENTFVSKQVMNAAQVHWNAHHLPPDDTGRDARIVFGLVTASMVVGLANQDLARQSLGDVQLRDLKFTAPVRQGETLYAFTEVLDTAVAAGDDAAGLVTFKHWGVTHDDRCVFEGIRTVRMKRRPAGSALS